MKRFLIILAVLCALTCGLFSATRSNSTSNTTLFPSLGLIREPILIYDVTGSIIAGPIHCKLTVYNDGLATIAQLGIGDQVGSAQVNYLPLATVDALRMALLLAGAHTLIDNPQFATDSPITTVTFFANPRSQARANTYSYYVTDNAQFAVQFIINEFISTHFPGFCFTKPS